MSNLLAFAVPVTPGKEAEWKKFSEELKTTRYKDFVASRKKMNIRERTFSMETPHGIMVVVTLEGADPMGAMASFGTGDDDFTKWFVKSVKEIHGFDLTAPPPGPPPELVVDTGAL